MIWKIIISIFIWIFYILVALSVLFAMGNLIRVLIWNKIRRVYWLFRKPKQEKDILEKNPFQESCSPKP